MGKPRTKVTPKQAAFARAYLDINGANGNGALAARQAGYAAESSKIEASRQLTKANVREYMLELAEQQAEVPEITRELVTQGLFREARTAKQDGARVRSLELLGKAQGMFDGDGGQDSELDSMSLSDLTALSDKLTSAVKGLQSVGPVIDNDGEPED